MLKRDKEQVHVNKYFDHKFFIRSFICEKCGNEFWFEYGMVPDERIEIYLPKGEKPTNPKEWEKWGLKDPIFSKYLYPKGEAYHNASKFCDICSQDLTYLLEKYPEDTDEFNHIAIWLNGTPIDQL